MLSRRAFVAAGLGLPAAWSSRLAPLIDSHVHVWTKNQRYPFAANATPPEIDASAETLIKMMDLNGVAKTVLIQVIHYKWDNRYLVDVVRKYPGRFAGVCRVDPEDPNAPDHLSELTAMGCRGVRLSPVEGTSGDWIRGALMPPLWRRCAELKVPMTLLLPVSRLPDVAPLIERHPNLMVVIDHMADCPVDDPTKLRLLIDLARYPKVNVKISHMWSLSRQEFPYSDAMAIVARLRDAFGAERLMWGTDWPIKPELLSYGKRISLYQDHLAFLNAEERENVLFRTVQRVWPFGIN